MVHQHVIWHVISFPFSHPDGLQEVREKTDTGSGLVFNKFLHPALERFRPHGFTPVVCCSETWPQPPLWAKTVQYQLTSALPTVPRGGGIAATSQGAPE